MGGKFKVQDSDLEYLCWRLDKHIALSEKSHLQLGILESQEGRALLFYHLFPNTLVFSRASHALFIILIKVTNFYSIFLQSNRTCPICRGDAASFFNGMPGGNASPPLTASTASNQSYCNNLPNFRQIIIMQQLYLDLIQVPQSL